MGGGFSKDKCKGYLSAGITRANIHRTKKMGAIAKNKDTICSHLNSSNEVNAKIWCETLINDENMIPVYDIACTMCDQVKGRIEYIAKFGPPKDMTQTFATLIHVAPKLNVEELMKVREQLTSVLGKEFVLQADEDYSILNPVVASNIDFKKPEDGEVIYRMLQLAKERNIQYEPSYDMRMAVNAYRDRKGLPDPFDDGSNQQVIPQPQYNPSQGFNNNNQPPPQMPPGGPPGG